MVSVVHAEVGRWVVEEQAVEVDAGRGVDDSLVDRLLLSPD